MQQKGWVVSFRDGWQRRLFRTGVAVLPILPAKAYFSGLFSTKPPLLMSRYLAALFSLLLLAGSGWAQPRLLSPAEFLGYELGERFTPHHRVVDYVEHVAAASPNVEASPYGETYEHRPLMTAFIAQPEYLRQLETIRTNNLRLAGLAEGEISGPTAAIVWLSYNVHGNESVSTESAMQVLYDLANPSNAQTQRWLEDVVVILDPCINPDGRDRYVHWYNETVGRVPNPNLSAREHREPWPGGRANHYWFDLNRDWAWATQQETQQRLALYQRWMPHVHADYHEQGVNSPYYFAPAAEPYHEAITPWQRELQTLIGQRNAEIFDREAWLYFTRQVFDLFYPGYGDTWPTFNGATGMTYEQGGSSRAGLAVITSEGDTLTLRDRIDHHHATSLATVAVTAENKQRTLDEFQAFFSGTPDGAYKAYVVPASNGADQLRALQHHLDTQEIRYGFVGRERRARGYRYADGTTAVRTLVPGDLVVSLYQPKRVLANVLFEPEATLVDSVTYDITAWALPYLYDLDAYALTERLDPELDAPRATPGAPPNYGQPYAYLVEWSSLADAQFLADLLQHGIKLRFASGPFTLDGRTFGRGTLIVSRTGNTGMGNRFDEIVQDVAAAHRQPMHPARTGFVTTGADFGSGDVPFLAKPNVVLLVGEGTSSLSAGALWHFFDQTLRYPVTLVDTDHYGSLDLDDYDVLILPSGSYGRLLNDNRMEELRGWIRGGGRVVALGSALSTFAGREGFGLKRKSSDEADADSLRRYADRERDGATNSMPGAIYQMQLDNSHPLAYGFGDVGYTIRRSRTAYEFLEGDRRWNVGVIRAGGRVSGFAGAQADANQADSMVLGVEEIGGGQVIYFADDPLFRGLWYAGQQLFSNAVFLVGQR